jgi:hypothetical protein
MLVGCEWREWCEWWRSRQLSSLLVFGHRANSTLDCTLANEQLRTGAVCLFVCLLATKQHGGSEILEAEPRATINVSEQTATQQTNKQKNKKTNNA